MHSGPTLRTPQSAQRRSPASTTADGAPRHLETASPPTLHPLADLPSPPPTSGTPRPTAHARSMDPSFSGAVTQARGPQMSVNIAELKRRSVPDLQEMAEGFSVENPGALGKQELIFRIEQKLLDQNVAL